MQLSVIEQIQLYIPTGIVTSAKEGGYVFKSVCLSVCLFDQVIQFWWRSGSHFGSGSAKSEIRILRIAVFGGSLCSLSISSCYDTVGTGAVWHGRDR